MASAAADRTKPAAPAETLLTDLQRRIVLALFAAGIGFLLVGLLLVPHGVVFWLAFGFLPLVAGGVAALLGGDRARGLDAWFRAGGVSKPPPRPVPATALPEALRAAWQLAAVPVLLGELHRAAATMPLEEKAAADRLLAVAVGAWNGTMEPSARAALARDLPRLVAGLVAGGPQGVGAAREAALRLASPPGGGS
jgi:hypothetical protein